jgi:hypothetical protein
MMMMMMMMMMMWMWMWVRLALVSDAVWKMMLVLIFVSMMKEFDEVMTTMMVFGRMNSMMMMMMMMTMTMMRWGPYIVSRCLWVSVNEVTPEMKPSVFEAPSQRPDEENNKQKRQSQKVRSKTTT